MPREKEKSSPESVAILFLSSSGDPAVAGETRGPACQRLNAAMAGRSKKKLVWIPAFQPKADLLQA